MMAATNQPWDSYGQAATLFLRGATVATAGRISVVVGTWLSLVNQGGAILDGTVPWVKLALNFATPFVVASLGFPAARRRRNLERLVALLPPAPPRAAPETRTGGSHE